MSPHDHDYEITFLVAPLDDAAIEALYEHFDCLAGDDFEGRPFVTMTCVGPDAFTAAKTASTELACTAGVKVLRTLPDYVSRSEIAERAGVSRQNVAQWVTGQRRRDFPPAVSSSGGGIWLWGDVHRWLVKNGIAVRMAEMRFPTEEEHERINVYLHMGSRDVMGPASVSSQVTRGGNMRERYSRTSIRIVTVAESVLSHGR